VTGHPGGFAARFEPAGEPVGTAIALPGRYPQYSALLLGFSALVLTQHGWAVEQVWWDPPSYDTHEQTTSWVREQVENALPESGRVLLVGKSLATYAAPLAAERGYEAVWLTPLLQIPSLVDAIAANPAPQLLVGGTADESWDATVARGLAARGCDVLEVPGADHGMLAAGDVVRSAETHVEIVRAMDAFCSRLG
jgi:hypothetical protein